MSYKRVVVIWDNQTWQTIDDANVRGQDGRYTITEANGNCRVVQGFHQLIMLKEIPIPLEEKESAEDVV